MKKFSKVTLIVVAILAGLGIVLCGIAAAMGAGIGTVYNMAKNGEFDTGNWHFGNGIYFNSELSEYDSEISQVFEASKINAIYLDIDAAEIDIVEESNEDAIGVTLDYGYEKYLDCSITDNGTLTIKYDMKNITSGDAVLTISLPAGKSYESFVMDAGAGDVNIDCSELTAKTMEFSMGAGDLDAANLVVSDTFTVSAGAGNISIDEGKFQDMKLDAGVGQLTLYGTVQGNLDASCGVGELDLYLTGNETEYNYELSCGLGEIEVNDTSYSNLGGKKSISNEGADKTITLDCGVGAIYAEIY